MSSALIQIVNTVDPKKGLFDIEKFKAAMKNGSLGISGKTKTLFRAPVKFWKHKPMFVSRFIMNSQGISLWVHPSGPNTKQFTWVDQGVDGHKIYARRRPMLRYRVDYNAATKPRSLYGGRARRSGPYTVRRVTNWFGIEPREFTQQIAERMAPEWSKMTQRSILVSILGKH